MTGPRADASTGHRADAVAGHRADASVGHRADADAGRRARPGAGREAARSPFEAILRDLPPEHREILAATYFRQQTTRQAARQLGVTDEEIRRRVYHATRHLAAALRATRPDRPDELPTTNPDRWRRGDTGRRHGG